MLAIITLLPFKQYASVQLCVNVESETTSWNIKSEVVWCYSPNIIIWKAVLECEHICVFFFRISSHCVRC